MSIYNITPIEGDFSTPSVAHWKDNYFICVYSRADYKIYLSLIQDTDSTLNDLQYSLAEGYIADGWCAKILKNETHKNAFEILYSSLYEQGPLYGMSLKIDDDLSYILSDPVEINCKDAPEFTFFLDQKNMYLSNVLDGCHKIYQFSFTSKNTNCLKTNSFQTCNLFDKLREKFDDNGAFIQYIHPSSPAISYSKNHNVETYIAVGVIEFDENSVPQPNNNFLNNNYYNNFIALSKKFMFIYEFNYNGEIVACSDFFIPCNKQNSDNYLSSFGITQYNFDYLISYSDKFLNSCKLLKIAQDEMMWFVKGINVITKEYKSYIDPDQIKFISGVDNC
jgi:hypothetical protein